MIEAIAGWLPLGLGRRWRRGGARRSDSAPAVRPPPAPVTRGHPAERVGADVTEPPRWPTMSGMADRMRAEPAARWRRPSSAPSRQALPRRSGRCRRGGPGADRPSRATRPTSPRRCPATWWRSSTSSSACGSRATRSWRPRAPPTRRPTWTSTPTGRSRCRSSARRTCSITGTGADVFALPPGGGTSELTFTAQALGRSVRRHDRGEAGHRAVGSLTLKATAVAADRRRHDAARHHGRGRHAPRSSTPPSSRGCRASRSTSAS